MDFYRGEVDEKTKTPNGRGILIDYDGNIAEGVFSNGRPKGKCRMTTRNWSVENVFNMSYEEKSVNYFSTYRF